MEDVEVYVIIIQNRAEYFFLLRIFVKNRLIKKCWNNCRLNTGLKNPGVKNNLKHAGIKKTLGLIRIAPKNIMTRINFF